MPLDFTFRAKLWKWQGGEASWHFMTLPKTVSRQIEKRTIRVGFGSVPVTATVGEVTWKTSIFPDSKRGAYLLPVKAAVRAGAKLTPDRAAQVHIRIGGDDGDRAPPRAARARR
jgi:hypothetical protein